ncbi:porin family protein [Ferruginibacter lapsinanis]|uniref:outer membrane beta-barrel protein n=1 Tax=Ferruginibacter lapsinanis TaxID=563172 RepID=UPI001E2D1D16|nr:outer membrane beta-barrel protein [Ferruginibacter lapsinanis]UEG49112.1 porin family protein [Ferruginibacter lapsinanis]
MKKIYLSFFVLIGLAAQAQHAKYPIYLRGDLGISNVKTNGGKGNSTIALGIGAETFLTLKKGQDVNLSLNPNLSYLHTGYENTGGGRVKVNYLSLGLPVCLFLGNNGESIGLFFGAGPFVNIATSGKFRNSSIDNYKTMSFGNGSADNRKSIDAGFILKSGLRIKKANMGLQYNIGTTNLIPKDRITTGSFIKSRNFLFYISYLLGK